MFGTSDGEKDGDILFPPIAAREPKERPEGLQIDRR
jgi:hypothetical protein